MTTYGEMFNPYGKLREPCAVKRIRQSIVIRNNPSTIDLNKQLLVWFPNLSNEGVLGSSRTGSSGYFHGSVLGQDTSRPQPSTGETQERHEQCELLP